MLTFKRAFKASGVHAIYHRILSGKVESPRAVNPTIPRDLEAVCLKAMETVPRRRYASANKLAEDLRRVRTLEATVARPISRLERLIRKIRRNPLAAAGLGAALVLALVAVAVRIAQREAVGGSKNAFAALLNVQAAAREHRAPPPADEAVVKAFFPDETSYQLFLAAPDSPEAVDRYLARVETKFRGEPAPPGPVRLLAPRCGIRDSSPTFRFELGAVNAGRRPAIKLTSAEGEVPLRLDEAGGGALVGVLATGTALTPGIQYRWSVELPEVPGKSKRVEVGTTFWVVPAEKQGKLGKLASFGPGREALDILARAAVLMSLGLAQDVLGTLDKLPSAASAAESRSAGSCGSRPSTPSGTRTTPRG